MIAIEIKCCFTLIIIFFSLSIIVVTEAKPLVCSQYSIDVYSNTNHFLNSTSYNSLYYSQKSKGLVEIFKNIISAPNTVSPILFMRCGNINKNKKTDVNKIEQNSSSLNNNNNNNNNESISFLSKNLTNCDENNEINNNKSTNSISQNQHHKPHLLKSIHNLFRSFSFKGIGLTVSKSIVEWSTFGCGIKLPITPNFPNYDAQVHLPRIGLFIGMIYPHCSARLNISISLPIQTVLYLLVILLTPFLDNSSSKQFTNQTPRSHSNTIKQPIKTKDINQKLKRKSLLDHVKAFRKKIKATDSVRRVGFTLSYKYDRLRGLSYSIGPWIYYLPGIRTMNRILPFILFPPTVLITIVALITRFFTSLGVEVKNEITSIPINNINNSSSYSLNKNITSNSTIMSHNNISCELESLRAIEEVKTLNNIKYKNNFEFDSIPIRNYDMFLKDCNNIYNYWKKSVDKWASKKTTGFAYNLGWYRSAYTDTTHKFDYATSAMGSSVQFEVSPFFPFYDLLFFQSQPINSTISSNNSYNISNNNVNLFPMNSNNSSSILVR